MIRRSLTAVLAVAVLVIALPQVWADERLVTLPVVVGQVAGANGSWWESRIRIVRTSDDPVRIRRVWVAFPDGGYYDDPQTAPSWTLGVDRPHEVVLSVAGEYLLGGESNIGAVQLAIDGDAHVLERVADTSGTLPNPMCGEMRGQGQIVPAFSDPLTGPCFIPWADRWSYFRNNLGIVNPNDTPMGFSVSAISMVGDGVSEVAPPLEVVLPAYGFRQLNQVLAQLDWQHLGIECVFIITVEPEDGRPYYAYGSMVYSSKNDPEFIAPVSGTVGGLP